MLIKGQACPPAPCPPDRLLLVRREGGASRTTMKTKMGMTKMRSMRMIMMTGCMTHRKGLLLTPMGHAGQSAGGFGGLGVRIFFWGGGHLRMLL